MKRATIAVVALPIGCDCSGEIGWFAGANKYVCSFIINTPTFTAKEQIQSLKRNWMIKGFLSEVLVYTLEDFEELKLDPILGNKVTLVK